MLANSAIEVENAAGGGERKSSRGSSLQPTNLQNTDIEMADIDDFRFNDIPQPEGRGFRSKKSTPKATHKPVSVKVVPTMSRKKMPSS